MRIMLVEDHERFAEFIRVSLGKAGFTVDAVHNAEDAEAAFSAVNYDAVLLDLGLPDADGLDLLKDWRSRGHETPVLIITARDGVDDRVHGLNLGGDDYLVKPFAMEELIARVRALLRRPGGVLGTVMTAGNITFDAAAREVQIGGKIVPISRREMAVLEHLMRRLGHVVPKDVIEDKIYGFDEEVSSNSVEVHVSRLRKRLSEAEAKVTIHTLRGIGYLLSDDDVAPNG